MQTFVDVNGNSYPVSDATPITDPAGWTFDETRQTLALWKGGKSLTDRQRAWLTADTNRQNMQRVVEYLAGRDFRDVGPTLDCVHGQRWTPDTCECSHDMLFHHFVDGEPKAHRVYKCCGHHQQHKDNPNTHHECLKEESHHCGKAKEIVATELGVDSSEVKVRFDANRELHIEHAGLKATGNAPAAVMRGMKTSLAEKLASELRGRKVHLS